MKNKFCKYHGTGNDFVLINNINLQIEHSPELALRLCDRHFGIGSDGIIIIERADTADFKMIFIIRMAVKVFVEMVADVLLDLQKIKKLSIETKQVLSLQTEYI